MIGNMLTRSFHGLDASGSESPKGGIRTRGRQRKGEPEAVKPQAKRRAAGRKTPPKRSQKALSAGPRTTRGRPKAKASRRDVSSQSEPEPESEDESEEPEIKIPPRFRIEQYMIDELGEPPQRRNVKYHLSATSIHDAALSRIERYFPREDEELGRIEDISGHKRSQRVRTKKEESPEEVHRKAVAAEELRYAMEKRQYMKKARALKLKHDMEVQRQKRLEKPVKRRAPARRTTKPRATHPLDEPSQSDSSPVRTIRSTRQVVHSQSESPRPRTLQKRRRIQSDSPVKRPPVREKESDSEDQPPVKQRRAAARKPGRQADKKAPVRAHTSSRLGPKVNGTPVRCVLRMHKQYYDAIMDGTKDIEVRCNCGKSANIVPGDRIGIKVPETNEIAIVIALEVAAYPTFVDLLTAVGVQRCLPDVLSVESGSRVFHSFPRYPQQVKEHGAVAILVQVEDMAHELPDAPKPMALEAEVIVAQDIALEDAVPQPLAIEDRDSHQFADPSMAESMEINQPTEITDVELLKMVESPDSYFSNTSSPFGLGPEGLSIPSNPSDMMHSELTSSNSFLPNFSSEMEAPSLSSLHMLPGFHSLEMSVSSSISGQSFD